MLCWHRHTLLSDSGGNLYNSKSTPISPTYIGECQFTLVVGLKYIPHPVNLFFNLTVCHFLAGNIQETSADYFTVLSEWLLLWRSNDKRPISLYVDQEFWLSVSHGIPNRFWPGLQSFKVCLQIENPFPRWLTHMANCGQ